MKKMEVEKEKYEVSEEGEIIKCEKVEVVKMEKR